MRDVFLELQSWYNDNCDGDWEHTEGVSIDTLDNPGWAVEIGTYGAIKTLSDFQKVSMERSEHDWVFYWVEFGKFFAYGGPENLEELLTIFLDLYKAQPDEALPD